MRTSRLVITLALSLFFMIQGHSQTLFTWAQRARTPAAAHAVMLRSESLPSNVVNTLISAVSSWPKENVTELCKRSTLPINEKFLLLLAEKYGTFSTSGERIPDPFQLSDIITWSKKWEKPSRTLLEKWLSLHPQHDLTPDQFRSQWIQNGGENFPPEILK